MGLRCRRRHCFLLLPQTIPGPLLATQIVTKFHYSRVAMPEKLTHHTLAEVVWTIIPTCIVVMIAIPSLTLIYSLDQHSEKPGGWGRSRGGGAGLLEGLGCVGVSSAQGGVWVCIPALAGCRLGSPPPPLVHLGSLCA